jgi:hypothetical protein
MLGIQPETSRREDVESISLWTKIKNPKQQLKKNLAFTERQTYMPQKEFLSVTPFWERSWEAGDKYCIQNQTFKYIHKTALEDECYNLKNDPFELNNLIQHLISGKENQHLRNKILKIISDFKKYTDKKTKKVNKKTLRRLKSLGYIH